MYKEKKRFVAGAICPRCEALDKIVVYSLKGIDYRECVHCDFKDELHFNSQKKELYTRVNQVDNSEENKIQIVNIIPSDPKKAH